MKPWLLVVAAGFSAGSASAASPLAGTLQTQEPRHFSRNFNLQVLQQESSDISRTLRSGMIAQTGVAPNMEVGLGLFSVRKNRANSLEPKPDARVKQSRKLGLNFSWRF